ncbi:hypothetical protein NC653_005288 [Populus alba x Populus x berolinensis]|uniref:Uncharacterized protein n=1 Tax=Populus alba x Populus x berolinensis TaxID=444605 RepID=A0AAD6RCT4_9ROSI|nr:hypothetical protein NC653_005288 [Populus alba x Populus x berolinensis]
MSPVVSEILRSGFMMLSSLRRRITHLVQSFSVVPFTGSMFFHT